MLFLMDGFLGEFKWYRRTRGGRWQYASCVDGGWIRDDRTATYPTPDVEDYRQFQTRCWCPTCRTDLVSNPRTALLSDVDEVVRYRCECGAISRWFFGAPVPIYLDVMMAEPPQAVVAVDPGDRSRSQAVHAR